MNLVVGMYHILHNESAGQKNLYLYTDLGGWPVYKIIVLSQILGASQFMETLSTARILSTCGLDFIKLNKQLRKKTYLVLYCY